MNNEERIYYVYKHTNLINGKVYIGQTRQEPEKRWKNGLSSYRHNAHFLAAIKKYGWENFSHEILKEKLTYKEMKYWEDFYVEYYDARNPEKGYNIIAGGLDSPFQELWNDPAFREKMSKQQSELMKERLKDPEKIELLRQAMKKYWSEHPERKEEFAKESSERMKKGKWAKNQIIPRMIISAVFRNIKPDDELSKDLLAMTKGGVSQAMKRSTRDYETVKSFVEGTKILLEENYKKDNKTFADLKKLADEHPEKYEKLMAEMLQMEIDERVEEGKKEQK